jgi:hypothetical protein
MKATVAQTHEFKVTKRDLEEITQASKSRIKRQQTDRRVVQAGGTLYARDAREAVIACNNKDQKGGAKGRTATQGEPSAAPPAPPPFEITQWLMPETS